MSSVMPTAYLRSEPRGFEKRARRSSGASVPVGDRRRLSEDLISKAGRDAAKAHGSRHGRGGTAAACALNLDRFGEAGVSERSLQMLVEQDVCPDMRGTKVSSRSRLSQLVRGAPQIGILPGLKSQCTMLGLPPVAVCK